MCVAGVGEIDDQNLSISIFARRGRGSICWIFGIVRLLFIVGCAVVLCRTSLRIAAVVGTTDTDEQKKTGEHNSENSFYH